MNDEHFNISMRKFLKKVGVTSQQKIEQAVRSAEAADELPGEALPVHVVLEIPALGLSHEITGTIATGDEE